MKRSLVVVLAFFSSSMISGQDLQEGTWGGTLTRANPNNPRPQRQKFALEFKKAPDPHWAWRPGAGDTWNVTVIGQGGRAQAIGFRVEGDALSFSYRRQDTIMTCQLARQPDASFEGNCVGDGDPAVFRLSLIPAKTPPK
jgi:hypothetical protein